MFNELKVLIKKGFLEMTKYPDRYFIGNKFGRLTVQYMYGGKDKSGNTRRFCHCICDCGNEKDVTTKDIVAGLIKSCGCLHRDVGRAQVKAMAKHNCHSHPLYQTWITMIKRCNNPKCKSYINYGGRGISVCKEWVKTPKEFIECCLKKGWKKGLTIDRIDNNGNYEPNNIRFTTKHIQSTNRRVFKNNTSGYTGVYWRMRSERWVAEINVNRKAKVIGYFNSKKEALDARNKYIIENNLTEYKIQEWKGE